MTSNLQYWREYTCNLTIYLIVHNSQGFGNRIFICENAEQKVLVRYYGGNVLPRDAPIRTLNEVTEVLVFHILGTIGYGPKLLGVFDGGRIEQYIHSRGLTIEEWVAPEISQSIAISMARFHLIDIPIAKNPWKTGQILKDCFLKFKTTHPELKPGGDHLLQGLIDFNMAAETEWIENMLQKVKTRVVFCHNDLNRSNVLFRLDGADDQILPIDYEFSGYNYRGSDIGNYFCMRYFDFGAEKFITGLDYPDEETRRSFVQAYIDGIRKNHHYDDFDEDSLDSIDHILLEAELGALMARIINIAWTLRDLDFWTERIIQMKAKDPSLKDDPKVSP